MRGREQKEAFLNDVCAQVRWKQAHAVIRRDLSAHMEDQLGAFLNAGISEEEAEVKAVAEMGDPVEVGARLDDSYRPKSTAALLIPLGILLLLGVLCRVFFYNRSPADWMNFILALAIGGGGFALLYNARLHGVAAVSAYGCVACVALSALALCFLLLANQLWYRNWLVNLTLFNYIVCVFPMLLSGLAYALRGKGMPGLLLCGGAVAVPVALLVLLPSAANALELVLSCLMALTVAIVSGVFRKGKLLPLAVTYLGTAAAGFAFVLLEPYRLYRLGRAFRGEGFYADAIREVFAGARTIGPGTETTMTAMAGFFTEGQGRFNAMNDFLLVAVAQRWGWLPAALLVAALMAFLAVGFYRAFRLKSLLGCMLGCGVMAAFAVQTLLYVLTNLGVFVGGPLPLPFLSYGNTALAVNLAMAGLLAGLFRTDGLNADSEPNKRPLPRLRVRLEWEN